MSVEGLSDDELRRLVSEDESESLEFKRELANPRQVARDISALANANGGRLIVGVDERQGPIGVADPAKTKRALETAIGHIQPSPSVTWDEADLDGHPLFVVEVGSGAGPYAGPDGAFVRQAEGGRKLPLTGPELALAFQDAAPDESRERVLEDALAQMNKRLATLEEQTSDGFEAAEQSRRWKAQLPGWMISAVIGAVMGAGLTGVLGG